MSSATRKGVHNQKKSTRLAQLIVDEIVAGKLSQGDRLANEATMCEQYGVGRSTIREALRMLETRGVITIKTGPGGGPIVQAFDPGFLAANMALNLQLSKATLRDVLNARVMVEPQIAAIAAREHPGNANAMFELAETVDRSASDDAGRAQVLAESVHFHDLMAMGSGNPLFEQMLLALSRITEPFVQRMPYCADRQAELIVHHQAIVDAIAQGDPEAAAEAMRLDLLAFIDYVDAEMPTLLDEPIHWSTASR